MHRRLNCGVAGVSSLALAVGKRLLLVLGVLSIGVPVLFAQANGIGTYDLRSPEDIAVAFDYNGTGTADHLLLYRPGTGIVYIVADNGGQFTPVFSSSTGIGGYDLKSSRDRIVPFDYNGSGSADHLVCYRPGNGIVFIIQNIGGVFSPVYTSGTGSASGIGGYDLASVNDRIMAFDYNGSGLNDHLLAYRPGSGIAFVLANTAGAFSPVYASGAGIGGWPLTQAADLLVPLDYYSIGSADHLIAYRPGSGMVRSSKTSMGYLLPSIRHRAGSAAMTYARPMTALLLTITMRVAAGITSSRTATWQRHILGAPVRLFVLQSALQWLDNGVGNFDLSPRLIGSFRSITAVPGPPVHSSFVAQVKGSLLSRRKAEICSRLFFRQRPSMATRQYSGGQSLNQLTSA